ncbi:MAG: alpha/beta hydrolase [Chitinophagaceae bacterium]|nr:alpha/beta hydrolase [Chitinophagaceae bacterium]
MQKTFQYQDTSIHYTLQGKGKKVVLLHGFGETAAVWEETARVLAKDFEVLVPDVPGSGDAAVVADMSMEGLAGSLKALTDSIGWREFVLIGHSMGGYIALAFAELYPDTLKGLGLFHSTAYPDSEEKKATRRKGITFIREHGAQAFLETTSANLFAPLTKDEKPEIIDEFLRAADNFSADALVSYYESMIARPDRSALLGKVAYPVLIVMGKYDQAVPVKDTLQLCKLPKKAYIHTLTQSGHMGMLEEPQRSHSLLHDFLSDC